MSHELEHDFTLSLKGNWDRLTDEMFDRLFEAGCDDATPSFRAGRVFVTFTRSAPSMRQALISAVCDVKKAGYEVDRIAVCDLVSQAEIARRSGRTRQQVNQWATGKQGPKGFPPPDCQLADDHALWRWCEVAHWMYENALAGKETWESARDIEMVNLVLEACTIKRLDPDVFRQIVDQLAGECEVCSEHTIKG